MIETTSGDVERNQVSIADSLRRHSQIVSAGEHVAVLQSYTPELESGYNLR